MGGKSGTTTQSVQIPKEVLARYNAVNSQAQSVAATPFQKYSTNPNDFVAGMNQQQYGGIGQINQAANMAQPSIAYAQQGLTGQGYQKGVQEYMNPYLQNAMGATAAQMQNVNQQQQNQLTGNAIQQGAFGGDRAGIARNNLINQQNLAMGQTLGQMANQGYQQSAQNYMQGMNSIGQLGLQGQQAALQGGQAMLGAGTLEQQTQQAGQTALYNQFLQQQAYPFQVAQFLANIAMGTGGLSGSTTTTTQPMPFFSDRRLKKNVERIGQTDEGLPIHKFEYKGDPKGQKHIGLMADEVEQVHPEAVGTHKSGYKVVDYDRATSEGGAVTPQRAGLGFADGGDVAAGLNAMNASQANMPVMGGGVNAGLAAAAEAIAPRPNVPQSAFYEPSYNPFADPKYRPDLNGTNTSGSGSSNNNGNGDGTGNRNGHDDHRRYQGAYGDRRGDSSPYSNPFNDSSYSADSNGMLRGRDMGFVDGYDPTQGPAYAAGGRAGYAEGGYSTQQYDPMRDPNSIENIIARQMAMYAKNEGGHHVPVGRSLSTGMGKYGRLPEANLPVRSSLMQAGSAPSLPESGFKQALGAATDTSDLFTKSGDLYKTYLAMKDKWSAPPTDEEKKSHGGLVGNRHGYSLGSDVPEKDKKETPVDELYSSQNTPTKLDILANMDRSKLSEAGKPPTPTSQTGLSLGEAASLGKTLGSFIMPFFLKDGGRAGYDVGGALTEEEIMKRAAYDPTMLGTKFRGKVDPTAEFMRLLNLKQTATDTPDIYSREAQPANAPRLRYFQERMNRRGHEDVQPTDIYRSAEESAGLDLTMPAGAPRAKPYHSGHNYGFSGDFSGINEKSLADAREVAAEAGLTLGADFKNPDYPHVQGGKGSYGGLYNKYGEKIDMPPGFLQESHSGDVPASATEAAYANARLPNGRGVSGAPPSEGAEKSSPSFLDSLADMVGFSKANAQEIKDKNRQGADSTDLLLSILSGVGSMAGSNSPYLGAAILQGIGGGAKTYAGLRGQALERGLAQQGVDISEKQLGITERTQGLQALKYLQDRYRPLYDASGKNIIGYRDLNGGPPLTPAQFGDIMRGAATDLHLQPSLVPQSGFGGVGETAPVQGGATTGAAGLGAAGTAGEFREDRATQPKLLPPEQDKNVSVGKNGIIPLSHLVNPDEIQRTIAELKDQYGSAEPGMRSIIDKEITRLNGSLTKITDIAAQPQSVFDAITGEERKIDGQTYLKVVADAAKSGDATATLPDGSVVKTGLDPFAEANKKLYTSHVEEATNYTRDWKTTRQRLSNLAHIYQNWQAGRGSESWADINGIMKFFGQKPFDPSAVNYDAALKEAVNIAINRTSEFATGAPATGGEMSMAAAPDPKRDPDSLYKNITDTIGYGDLAYRRSQEFINKRPKDVAKFMAEFADRQANDPQTFLDRVHKEFGPFKGGNPANREALGIPTGEEAQPSQTQPNTLVIPKSVTDKSQWIKQIEKAPKGTRVLAPDGNYYDGQGK